MFDSKVDLFGFLYTFVTKIYLLPHMIIIYPALNSILIALYF